MSDLLPFLLFAALMLALGAMPAVWQAGWTTGWEDARKTYGSGSELRDGADT